MEPFGKEIAALERRGYRDGIFVKRVVAEAAEQEHLRVYVPIATGPAFTPT